MLLKFIINTLICKFNQFESIGIWSCHDNADKANSPSLIALINQTNYIFVDLRRFIQYFNFDYELLIKLSLTSHYSLINW